MATAADDVVRDFIAPADLRELVTLCLADPGDRIIETYGMEPVGKFDILAHFGIDYEVEQREARSWDAAPYLADDFSASYLGYRPTMTSLQTLDEEVGSLLCVPT